MKNVWEVLRQKELQLTRIETEVEALRTVAPLLAEEGEQPSHNRLTTPEEAEKLVAPPESADKPRKRIWP